MCRLFSQYCSFSNPCKHVVCRGLICLLALIVSLQNAKAQGNLDTAQSIEMRSLPKREEEFSFGKSILTEGNVAQKEFNGRISITLGGTRALTSIISVATQTDTATGIRAYSMNALLSVVGGLSLLHGLEGSGFPHTMSNSNWGTTLLGVLLLAPQVLGNWTYRFPLGTQYAYATFSQRTDFYLFNKVARIYCEANLGIQLQPLKNCTTSFSYSIPQSEGFLQSKTPFFSASVAYIF